jgi:hypothetical protein
MPWVMTSNASKQSSSTGQKGQALVELALVAPILLLIILGIAEAAHAYNAYVALINSAREGARLAARGNVFLPEDVLVVVESHAGQLDWEGAGSVLLTTAHSTPSSFTVDRLSLLGSETSRFSDADLMNLERQTTGSDPNYLRNEDFVVLEVFYAHHTISGFFGATLPMYAYTILPVSAPS